MYHPSQQHQHQSQGMEPRGPMADHSAAPLASAAGLASAHRSSPAVDTTVEGSREPGTPVTVAHHRQKGQHQGDTEGESVWNGAVNNVVQDETAHRGGQRPGLFTIESDVPIGASSSTGPPMSEQSRIPAAVGESDHHHGE